MESLLEHFLARVVALPWINDYSGNIQNLAEYENGAYTWNKDTTGLSWQPYLLYITKKICEDRGYKYDFSKWEESEEYKYLLICDTLPYVWNTPDFARALPHWTVAEFFEKLELFLGGEFTIIEIQEGWSNFRNVHFSMRLNRFSQARNSFIHQIDVKQKATFKFLSDTIPNPRSVFYIHGQRYLCEKITATFTENGMSQLLKGVFWPII